MKETIWLVESHLKFVMRRLMNYSWVWMFTSDLTHGWWREGNLSESTVGYRRWHATWGDVLSLRFGIYGNVTLYTMNVLAFKGLSTINQAKSPVTMYAYVRSNCTGVFLIYLCYPSNIYLLETSDIKKNARHFMTSWNFQDIVTSCILIYFCYTFLNWNTKMPWFS
jgi:hypothetical protein